MTYTLLGLLVMAVASAIIRAFPDDEKVFVLGESCELQTKLAEINQSKETWDYLFVGTSKTYRQIIPETVDQIAGSKSFNLGLKSNFPPRSWKLIEYLSEQEQFQNSTIVIELAPLNMIGANYQLLEINNAMNLSEYGLMIDYVSGLPLDLKTKTRYAFNYTRSLLYKYSGLGLALDVRSWTGQSRDKSAICESDSVLTTRGFLSADAELAMTRSSELIARNESLKNYDDASIADFFTLEAAVAQSEIEFNSRFLKLANEVKERGGEVVLIIPPRQGPMAMIAVQSQAEFLRSNGFEVHDFSDPSQYPELYTKDNSFDLFHLNAKGAEVYSKLIAQKLGSVLHDR